MRRPWMKLRRKQPFLSSSTHWENRYQTGGNSGAGSYGRLAEFKAEFLNQLVADKGWGTVLELGCGDGAQLSLATYDHYLGADVSSTAVELCRKRFADRDDREFVVSGQDPLKPCDVGLSLDVIYHLVEDSTFEEYMAELIGHATKGVVLYTSDSDVFTPPRVEPPHIRHRPVQRWMSEHYPEWRLSQRVPNPYPWSERDQDNTSFADFYVYER
jgi:SAM-dependent methyltransferase